MSYKVIPRFKVLNPVDPTMPYLSIDGKIVECVIVSNDDALILQNKYHLMSCQQANAKEHGMSGHVFYKTIISTKYTPDAKNKITQEKESVLKYLKAIGSQEIIDNASDDSVKIDTNNKATVSSKSITKVTLKKPIAKKNEEETKHEE